MLDDTIDLIKNSASGYALVNVLGIADTHFVNGGLTNGLLVSGAGGKVSSEGQGASEEGVENDSCAPHVHFSTVIAARILYIYSA